VNVLYVCKAVDQASPTVATQVRWIRALAARPEVDHVHVLASRRGDAELPANVTVDQFGGRDWPTTVAGFLRAAARVSRAEVDLFFVAQGGPYPALLLPFKLAWRRPLYQWKAHPHVSARMRFYARWCDDLIFTPTPGSFPAQPDKVRVVGHGIDTGLFAFDSSPPTCDLLALGRIAPIKNLEIAVRALASCRDDLGRTVTLDLVGPCLARDEEYRQSLVALAADLGISDQLRWIGSVAHEETPQLLGRYRATVNFSGTAFDKVAGESMAVGTPVVTSNPCTLEMLPPDLRDRLAVSSNDAAGAAHVISAVLSWDDAQRAEVGGRLRETIVRDHGLDSLFGKILESVAQHRPTAKRG
jgi:glycosyltransferase involved in cell wall biosynthesis